jgi:hypothetical protein
MPTIDEQQEQLQSLIERIQNQPDITLPTRPTGSEVDPGYRRSWTGLLGEALSGGQGPGYHLRGAEQDQANNRALMNFGISMLMNSGPKPYRPDLGSAIGGGLASAQESLGQSQAQAAAASNADYQARLENAKLAIEGQRTGIERIKGITELTKLQEALQQLGLRGKVLDGGDTSTAGGGGAPAFTGDKEKDRAIIVARESKGDPTAINYVAREDPTAIARGATASGKYGFTDSTWREGAAKAGIDVAKYPTARSAPEALQDKVFDVVYEQRGSDPWNPAKWGQNWVKGADGKYTLVKAGAAPAVAPGGATTAAVVPGATPGVQMGGAPPAPPGAPVTSSYRPGTGIGDVLNPNAARDTAVSKTSPTLRGPGAPDPNKVRADVEAIQSGTALAQAAPLVPGTGTTAGPGGTVAQTRPSYVPGQPEAFGAAVGSYGSTPAAPVAPVATTPVTPAPAATTAPAAPAAPVQPPLPPGMNGVTVQQYIDANIGKPTPEEEATFNTPLSPERRQAMEKQRTILEDAVRVARRSYAAGVDKDSGSVTKTETDLAKAIADNEKEAQEALKVGDTRKAEWFQKRRDQLTDVYKTMLTGAETRLTNSESVVNEERGKRFNELSTEAKAAGDRITTLEGLRVLSRQVGEQTPLDQITLPNGRSLLDTMVAYGWGTPSTLSRLGFAQAYRGMANSAIKELKQGLSLGNTSDKDMTFISNMIPGFDQSPETRELGIGILVAQQQRAQRVAAKARGYMEDPKVNSTEALIRAQKEEGPIFPQLPAKHEVSGQPMSIPEKLDWMRDHVQIGQPYRKTDGSVDIYFGDDGPPAWWKGFRK